MRHRNLEVVGVFSLFLCREPSEMSIWANLVLLMKV